MASNEHAFLSETNLHNPKGFSLASNNTFCSKDNAGALAWTSMGNIKTDTLTFAGYSTLIANYQYPEPMLNGQSPNELNKDYGSGTISSGTTVTQKSFFRVANHVLAKESKVLSCRLQITSDATNAFTVAIVKYTPTASATNVYPVALIEKSVTGSAHNTVISYSLTTSDFAVLTMEPGDHLFLMVKANAEGGVGDSVHVVAALEVGCTDYS